MKFLAFDLGATSGRAIIGTVENDKLTSEEVYRFPNAVKEIDGKGRVKEVWKPVTEHTPNHLLDCSVLATAAAERMGVRYLMPPNENQ